MLNSNDIETIKKTAEDFFKKITFEVEIEVLPEENQTIPINLKTEEPQILIGEGGQTLNEIQHLLKAILKKKITAKGPLRLGEDEANESHPEGRKETFYIDLDINNYKKKKIEYLKEMARTTADEVALTKKEKILAPMPAYERRIIHLAISERSDVVSESIGQEPERRVIIRPHP